MKGINKFFVALLWSLSLELVLIIATALIVEPKFEWYLAYGWNQWIAETFFIIVPVLIALAVYRNTREERWWAYTGVLIALLFGAWLFFSIVVPASSLVMPWGR